MRERQSVLAIIFSDNQNSLMSSSYFVGCWRASPVSDYEYGIGLSGLHRPHRNSSSLLLLTDPPLPSLASSALVTFRLSAVPTLTFPRDQMT